MKLSRIRISVVYIAVFSLIGASSLHGEAPQTEAYLWPLESQLCVTSLFGDYRDGHFHAGIDLSTNGREGKAVRAAGSGWVVRARASCSGYGKAVYLRLEDGRMAVYAHLSRFCPEIGRAVRRAQLAAGSYEVDMTLDPGEIPVRRGDVIGYTGQTGAGPPHLHFEIRDENEHPINPLLGGVAAGDTVPPVIHRLIIRPLDHASIVQGRRRDLEVPLSWDDSLACYVFRERIVCSGAIGILVEARDRMSACRKTLSVAGAGLKVDGKILFATRFGEFSYDETGRIDAYYDRGRAYRAGEEFHRLYRGPGNTFSFGEPFGPGDGVIEYRGRTDGSSGIGPGLHHAEVWVEDASGRTALARLGLVLDVRPVVGAPEARRTSAGLEVAVAVDDMDDDVAAVHVQATLFPGGRTVEYEAERRDPGCFGARVSIESGVEAVAVACVAEDTWGDRSLPRFVNVGLAEKSLNSPNVGSPTADSCDHILDLTASLGPRGDVLVISLEARALLEALPEVWFPALGRAVPDEWVEQAAPMTYAAVVPLTPEISGEVYFQASARDLAGRVVEGEGRLAVWHLSAETGGVVWGGAGFVARIDPGAALEDVWVTVRGSRPWRGSPELHPRGSTFEIYPADVGFGRRISVELPVEPLDLPAERIGICSPQSDTDWEWVGGEWDARSGRKRAAVGHLTEFCLAADLTPPRVAILKPKKGTSMTAGHAAFRARVSDEGSGLACDSVGMEIDGSPLIAEFDPELDLVSASRSLESGEHVLVVWARDRAGNRSEASRTFSVD